MAFSAGTQVLGTDSQDLVKSKINTLAELVGDVSTLNTTSTSSIIAALNGLQIDVNNVVIGVFTLLNNTYFLGNAFGGGTVNILRVNTSNKIEFGTQITAIDINGGTITSLTSPVPVAAGGTAASTAASARTNLGLAIGSNVQAWDANLDQIAAFAPTTDNFMVGNGSAWVLKTIVEVKSLLGLTIGTNVQAWDANLDQIAALAPVSGSFIVGSGAGTWGLQDPAGTRIALSLTVGTNVQAWDANLDQIAALAPTADNIIVGNGSAWILATPTSARTALGLGSIATQSAASVAITGGSVNGVSLEAVPTGFTAAWWTTTAPTGYVPCQGGTIGNASSGATVRANADCSALFQYFWNNLANAQAPVSSGRGASAAADFAANKTITIPDARQRFLIGKAASGTGAIMGETGGSLLHQHPIPHTHGMKAHTHVAPSHTHTQGNLVALIGFTNADAQAIFISANGSITFTSSNRAHLWYDNNNVFDGNQHNGWPGASTAGIASTTVSGTVDAAGGSATSGPNDNTTDGTNTANSSDNSAVSPYLAVLWIVRL